MKKKSSDILYFFKKICTEKRHETLLKESTTYSNFRTKNVINLAEKQYYSYWRHHLDINHQLQYRKC